MKQSVQLIIDALTNLAKTLGQTVSYLWPQYLRYIVADGIAGILCGFVLIWFIYLYWTRIFPKFEGEDAKLAGTIGGTIGTIVAAIFALVFIFGDIGQAVSPAGYAVYKILNGEKP